MTQSDLAELLRTMGPVLHPNPHGYGVRAGRALLSDPLAAVSKAEGLTVFAPLAEKKAAGMRSGPWALISRTVHSDLADVGLTATIATALGAQGISGSMIAGYNHDHLFVLQDRPGDAPAASRRLSIA